MYKLVSYIQMRIAIIGAGVAGIVTLKYALDGSHDVDCFEETETFGGTWVYSERTGTDEYGQKIHRTMYKDLITNLPKEVMLFSDFQYPIDIKKSFIRGDQVLEYLRSFIERFNLEKFIKYHEKVTKVKPEMKSKWTVTTTNVVNKTQTSKSYDSVFVCNGHFRSAKIPVIPGQSLFKGTQMHSMDYRSPDLYKDKIVLVIGASYSGTDIISLIQSVTKTVYLSHWKPVSRPVENVTIKPEVTEFRSQSVVFSDRTTEDVDVVIYCTGYEYKYPFLDGSTGITVENNFVQPLYKHIINIEHPSMFFIGIPFLAPVFWTCDIQARFCMAILEHKFLLPSKEEMMKELEDYVSKLRKENIPQRHAHKIGTAVGEYFADLTRTASIKPIPPVISKIYLHKIKLPGKETMDYIIVDDENYIIC